MSLVLYVATAAALLWLTHRFVRPLSRVAALLLIALPLGLVGEALITDSVYGPIDYLYQNEPFQSLHPHYGAVPPRNASATDVFSEFYPWRHAVRLSYARGEWPLWNAYNLCGHPLAAEAQSAPYSPFTLLALLLPSAISLTYTVAIVLFLAALSAFLLARDLECSEGAALVAAVGWGLASCIVLYSHTAMGFATAYLPLLLAGAHRIVHQSSSQGRELREPSPLTLTLSPRSGERGLALLTTGLALCLLAGHPESLFLNVIVGCAYGVFALARHRIKPWRPIATALIAGLVAAALCAIFLLPLLEALPQSAEVGIKSHQSEHSRGFTGMRVLAGLARDFFPYLHVRAWTSPDVGLIGAETSAAGSLILALAIYAIWRKCSAETWFFAATAVICIAAGVRWKPISDLLSNLPLLHITLHDRLAFAAALCLAILAAFGVDEIVRRGDRRAAATTFAVVFVVLALGTWWLTRTVTLAPVPGGYGRYRIFAELFFLAVAALLLMTRVQTRWLVATLIALVAGQRLSSEVDTFSTYPAETAWPKLALLEPLEKIRAPFRIVGRGDAFPPSSNTFYELEDARGYEALTLKQFRQTWQLWNQPFGLWYARVDDLSRPFLSFMNVRFAIQPVTMPVPSGWRTVATEKGSMLIENEHAIDRVFLPERVVVGNLSVDEIVDRMAQQGDFRALAWIAAPGAWIERQNGPGRITLRSRSFGGEYTFDADMQGDGWVVISDSAWLGWRAYINGRRVKMSRANAAFLSVYLPAGKQTVRVVYLPASFVRGRAITIATLIGIAIAIVYRSRKRNVLQRE